MDKQSHDGNRRPEFIDLLIPWRRRQVGDSWQELLAPSVITDKLDYRPGETAMITASGFRPGETITFTIADDPQDPGDDGDADLYQPFSVTDGGAGDLDGIANGQVVTTWFVPTDDDGSGSGTPDALNASLILTALGSKGQTAQVLFTDSGASVVTDKADYAPGETVKITASGFALGSTITFAIADDPNAPGVDNDADTYPTFAITDGLRGSDGIGNTTGDLDGVADGSITTTWVVPEAPDALNATLDLTATGTGADGTIGTDDDQTATTTFTDGGGSYSINFAAADPALYIPPIPYPVNVEPIAGRGNGNAQIASAWFNEPGPGGDVRIESLAPRDMALGQVVPFEIKITANGSTIPENGVITFKTGWNINTTSNSLFGYDPLKGVIAAFVDTGDGAYLDSGDNATVQNFGWAVVGDEIQGTFTMSGLDNGDVIVVEPWLVLQSMIPPKNQVGGNVQSRLIIANTGTSVPKEPLGNRGLRSR